MPTSNNGWSVIFDSDSDLLNARWEPVPGVRFPGGIRKGDVEVIFTYLVRNLHARVERATEYQAGDDWGWNPRKNVNDPDWWSTHASATSIDYNATQHPNRIPYTWARAQVREIRQIIDVELEGVIKWLEGYDEMHFEIRGGATAVKRVADKIRNLKKEPFTVGQYEEIMQTLGQIQSDVANIKQNVTTAVLEGRELDADIPENLADRTGELLRIGRAVASKVGAVVPPPNPG